MSDHFDWFRNSNGQLDQHGLQRVGAHEKNQGWLSTPQRQNETSREYEIRSNAYDNTKK